MGVYLYAIVPPGHLPPPGLAGVDGAAVVPLDAGALALWVSAMDHGPAASIEGVRAHNHVVEAALRVATPVPVRFGQWMESESALLRFIAGNEDGFRADLDRVAGAVEFGVRVIDPDHTRAAAGNTPDRSSGTAYLQSLARTHSGRTRLEPRALEIAEELNQAVAGRIRAHREEPLPSMHGLFSAAHLVGRHEISGYRAALDSFRARTEDLHFLVSGPWPPYSFVG